VKRPKEYKLKFRSLFFFNLALMTVTKSCAKRVLLGEVLLVDYVLHRSTRELELALLFGLILHCSPSAASLHLWDAVDRQCVSLH
jgi:hypothetical protein